MTDPNSSPLEEIRTLFIQWGAEASQAEVMAKQLLKRTKQISKEREISETEALETLLKQMVEARQGL